MIKTLPYIFPVKTPNVYTSILGGPRLIRPHPQRIFTSQHPHPPELPQFLTGSLAAAAAMAAANQHHLLPTTQPASSTAKNNNKRGLAGFSIDDILSHKTAQAMQVQQQLQAAAQQRLHAAKKQRLMIDVEGDVDTDENDLEDDDDEDEEDDDERGSGIVRPWDKAGSDASGEAAGAAAAGKGSAGSDRRKSVGDSPLDALFQMASKTFEGLKAKSGRPERLLTIKSKRGVVFLTTFLPCFNHLSLLVCVFLMKGRLIVRF